MENDDIRLERTLSTNHLQIGQFVLEVLVRP